MNTCFWAILGVQNLNFIHVSSSNEKLYQSSLYDLIHPEEVLLAKRDLNKFIHSNILGGSITRCRIKNDLNHMMQGSSSWIVIDIVMHVATNDFVLVFFHRPRSSSQSYCGDYEFTTTPKKRDEMIHQLRSNSNNAAERSPNQFLRILDDRTKSVLLSWPDHYPNEIIEAGAQMDFLNSRSTSSTEISCFHCVQKPLRINAFGHKIHSLVIEYGSILFVLTQVEKTKKLTLSLPSSPMYTYSNNKQLPPLLHQDDNMETEQHHSFYTRPRHPYRMARNSAPTSPTRTPIISHKLESLSLSVKIKQQQPPVHHHHHRNQCQSCGTENSPEWRRGPTGHKTLCNACGLRYSRSIARQSKMVKQEQQYHQHHQQIPNSPILVYHSTPPITYERNRHHSVL